LSIKKLKLIAIWHKYRRIAFLELEQISADFENYHFSKVFLFHEQLPYFFNFLLAAHAAFVTRFYFHFDVFRKYLVQVSNSVEALIFHAIAVFALKPLPERFFLLCFLRNHQVC